MKILLAVDGSPYTQKMLNYLASHQETLGAGRQYTIISVQSLLPPRARAALGKDTVDQYYAEEFAKIVQPVTEFLASHGVKTDAVTKVGHVSDSIIQVAKEGQYDLIIMGTHGHGSLGRLVMGSVSTQVLAGCDIPVMLIR